MPALNGRREEVELYVHVYAWLCYVTYRYTVGFCLNYYCSLKRINRKIIKWGVSLYRKKTGILSLLKVRVRSVPSGDGLFCCDYRFFGVEGLPF